MNPLWGE